MTKPLRMSDVLSLPMPDAAAQTYAFIGRKRSGKTYGAGKLIELLRAAGVQVIILDTVGNWFGLRLGADGKSKGLDIAVIGGLRGDVPLEETSGKLVADTLVDTGRSAILDVSTFSKAARQRFAADFGERLWLRRKSEMQPAPLTLVLEEAQLLVPEESASADKRMTGIYTEIVRVGGNYSIGVVMISQRPQSISKEVLNQTECLFTFQTNGHHERLALKKWIVAQGADTAMLDELPSLPAGTAYVWSPQWLSAFKRVKIAPKETFDSTATLKVGVTRIARKLEPLDLDDLKAKMAETIERAKADDPKALRLEIGKRDKRIAELERELQTERARKPEGKPIEKPILRDSDLAAFDRSLAKIDAQIRKFGELVAKLDEPAAKMREAARLARAPVPAVAPSTRPGTEQRIAATVAAARTPRPTNGHAGPSEVGNSGLRRMLIALAQRPQGLTNRQLGLRAGISSKSGTFATYLSRARQQGWIADQGAVRLITQAGIDALGSYEPLPTGVALLNYWIGELGQSGAARILTALANAYPNALSNAEIGEAANISAASGTFATYMSRLRGLELIQGSRGATKASDELFD